MSRPLVDKFGRIHKYLRISVTDRCNLSCNYCMPEAIPDSKGGWMTADEIARVARIAVDRCGVDKIRLTGGEPTIRHDFSDILASLSTVNVGKFGITTNGVLLDRYWDSLIKANLRLVNISLDTLDRTKFPLISNKPDKYWDRTWQAIERAVSLKSDGFIDSIKVNTVVMNHVNDDELVELVERLTHNWPVELRFIELMPFAGNNFSSKLFMSKKNIIARLASSFNLERVHSHASSSSSVGSDLYRVASFKGTVGVISSMTDAFCGTCDRLRLTAEGGLRNCLFSSTSSEMDLLGLARNGGTDHELEKLIRQSIGEKSFSHGGRTDVNELDKRKDESRPMVSIGG